MTNTYDAIVVGSVCGIPGTRAALYDAMAARRSPRRLLSRLAR